MAKIPGLRALQEWLTREAEPEVVDLGRRQFLRGFSLQEAPKSQLPALTEPSRKVTEELISRAMQGEGRAIQALTEASGSPPPRSQDELSQLVNSFLVPSRRGFLKHAGSAAAHLVMPSSPLKILQSTAEGLGGLKVELTPMELMEYSRKFMDKPLDFGFDDAGDLYGSIGYRNPGDSLPSTPIKELLAKYGSSALDNKYEAPIRILKEMDLEPTKQNMKSFDEVTTISDFFHPDSIDASFDDLKHIAQDYAAGDWETADDFLEKKAKELGVDQKELESKLADYLEELHKDSEGPNAGELGDFQYTGRIGDRRALDSVASDEAYDRGYMDYSPEDDYEPLQSDDDRLKESRAALHKNAKIDANDIDEGAELTYKQWRESLDTGEDDQPVLAAIDDLIELYGAKTKAYGSDFINTIANYFRDTPEAIEWRKSLKAK